VLVRNAFKLTTESDQVGVVGFETTLLVHHLGDFVRHGFGHFIAHVSFQKLQEVQFFNHLKVHKSEYNT